MIDESSDISSEETSGGLMGIVNSIEIATAISRIYDPKRAVKTRINERFTQQELGWNLTKRVSFQHQISSYKN